jgi:hypothetical protein
MNTIHRVGYWSAFCMFVVGLLYAFTLAVGMAEAGLNEPIRGPFLTTMEALTLTSAPLLVLLFSAICASAPQEVTVFGFAAFAFAVLACGLTAAVHFVSLTALRQRGQQGIEWPSQLYAVELLSWDFCLGLALVFAAPVFSRNHRAIRNALLLTGTLCLLGMLGPFTGNMKLQFVGVTGYGVALPVTSFLLARHFRQSQSPHHDDRRAA